MSEDELELDTLGGYHGTRVSKKTGKREIIKQKTALFVIISDTDASFSLRVLFLKAYHDMQMQHEYTSYAIGATQLREKRLQMFYSYSFSFVTSVIFILAYIERIKLQKVSLRKRNIKK